mmetsp:Transcript_34288/g.42279  ORF Transcript_34288/g.42279 Transcript_34288/m.42279 type:complete len:154 (-) Transcript_34288:29-490(-)
MVLYEDERGSGYKLRFFIFSMLTMSLEELIIECPIPGNEKAMFCVGQYHDSIGDFLYVVPAPEGTMYIISMTTGNLVKKEMLPLVDIPRGSFDRLEVMKDERHVIVSGSESEMVSLLEVDMTSIPFYEERYRSCTVVPGTREPNLQMLYGKDS